ncbi:hypothetical protein U5801_26985 [Lamprobacter modestohalophilus]|nr:hypothetical protein [Lamprobacter modestohalophilus]MEA1053421.1 hypothetical protein [Lamprobacter modestohalophilus]
MGEQLAQQMFKRSLLPATQVVDLLEQVNEIDAGKITARQLAARRLQPEKVIGVIGGCCVVGFTQ